MHKPNDEGKQICEIIVFDTKGKPDLSILSLKENANATLESAIVLSNIINLKSLPTFNLINIYIHF